MRAVNTFTRHARSLIRVLTAGVFCLAATSLTAQTLGSTTQRPTQGLFGSAPRGSQVFDVSASLVGAYEDNIVLVDQTVSSRLDGVTQESAAYNGVNGTANYAKQFRRVAFGVTGGSALRYYPGLSDVVGVHQGVTAGLAVRLDHTEIGVSQKLRYSPYYSIMSLPQLYEPDLAPAPDMGVDSAVIRRPARSYGSTASLTQTLGSRSVFRFLSSLDTTDFVNESTRFSSVAAMGRFRYKLSRDLGLVTGYRHQRGTFPIGLGLTAAAATLNTLDLGIDYDHALSLSRRTTIGFTTGTAVVPTLSGDSTQYRIVGTARLDRAIGRTWHATGGYNRGVDFIEGFRGPFFADTVAVDVGGSANRRVEFSMNGSVSFGQLGMLEHDARTQSYNGSTRVRVALSRVVALFGEYHIFRYRFDQAGLASAGMMPRLDRQGLRVGLDLWFPLIR